MKVDRHVKIAELIGKYDIETQEELADRLNAEGFQVTQATVSRDIRDMKLMKVPTQEGRQKYSMMHVTTMELTEKYMRVLKDGYLSMDIAQNLIVVKTVSGGTYEDCRKCRNHKRIISKDEADTPVSVSGSTG